MRSTLVMLLLVVLTTGGMAQINLVRFGEVRVSDMEPRKFKEVPDADAMYLYRFRRTYYTFNQESGLTQITDIHERIKIFNKNGLDYANKTISLYKSGSDAEIVAGIRGWTYNLVRGGLTRVKLDKKGIFKSKVSDNFNEVRIAMPDVREGSIVEYKYRLKTPFLGSVDEVEVQAMIPTQTLDMTLEIPEFFEFNQRHKGFLSMVGEERIKYDNVVGGKVKVIQFKMDDVPPLPDENYVRNLDNFMAAVEIEISSLKVPRLPTRNFSTTWEDVGRNIYNQPGFSDQLDETGYYQDDLAACLEGANGQTDKVRRILAMVSEKVKWNGIRQVSSTKVREAYKKGSGNSADINLLLWSMLRQSQVNAFPILISTADNGIPLFPTLQGFNYLIVGIPDGDNYILLDATSPYSEPNVLPLRALNWFGRLIIDSQGNSTQIPLQATKRSFDLISVQAELDEDGLIEGSVTQEYTRQNAMIFRHKYYDSSPEAFITQLQEQTQGLEVSNHEVQNGKAVGKNVSQSYDFGLEDVGELIGEKLYFSPMIAFGLTENPFKSDARNFPIDFGFPWMDKHTIEVALPEGYAVESLPKGVELVLPQNLGTYKITFSEADGKVTVSSRLSFRSSVISPNHYPALKEFFRQLVEVQTAKVVLRPVGGE